MERVRSCRYLRVIVIPHEEGSHEVEIKEMAGRKAKTVLHCEQTFHIGLQAGVNKGECFKTIRRVISTIGCEAQVQTKSKKAK